MTASNSHRNPTPLTLSLLFLVVVSLALFADMVRGAAYMGPRYGKRLPFSTIGGDMGRIVGRSGPRTIQSRSQSIKFYAGSRYGGKRSGPLIGSTDNDAPFPYDCIYVPFVGMRCGVLRSSEQGLDNEQDTPGEAPLNGPSPSYTRTSIIDTVPSNVASESE